MVTLSIKVSFCLTDALIQTDVQHKKEIIWRYAIWSKIAEWWIIIFHKTVLLHIEDSKTPVTHEHHLLVRWENTVSDLQWKWFIDRVYNQPCPRLKEIFSLAEKYLGYIRFFWYFSSQWMDLNLLLRNTRKHTAMVTFSDRKSVV